MRRIVQHLQWKSRPIGERFAIDRHSDGTKRHIEAHHACKGIGYHAHRDIRLACLEHTTVASIGHATSREHGIYALARFWFCNRLDDSILWNENTTHKILEKKEQRELDSPSKSGRIEVPEADHASRVVDALLDVDSSS